MISTIPLDRMTGSSKKNISRTVLRHTHANFSIRKLVEGIHNITLNVNETGRYSKQVCLWRIRILVRWSNSQDIHLTYFLKLTTYNKL